MSFLRMNLLRIFDSMSERDGIEVRNRGKDNYYMEGYSGETGCERGKNIERASR